jgi:uncharacterized membrane protein (UPF0127 family)
VNRRRAALYSFPLLFAAFCSPQNTIPPMTTVRSNAPAVVLADNSAVEVELAIDDETRAMGLMFRESIAPGRGMLFIHPTVGVYPFWMKNTLIPLDMIWIDENKRIVHIKQHVPPCRADPCPSYDPAVPSRYVLELGGGQAAVHRVRVGDHVVFRNIDESLAR